MSETSSMDSIVESARKLAEEAGLLAEKSSSLMEQAASVKLQSEGVDPFIFGITVFVLACFVGYYVVWKVTPALHTPLMSVTNAVSGIIVVGAMIALGAEGFGFSNLLGFIAVTIASINIFGGFVVTQRMLSMFKKK